MVANLRRFGLPHISFQAYAKGYGLNLSEQEAVDLKNQWFEAWDMTGWTRLAAKTIDEEVRSIIEDAFVKTKNLLREKVQLLEIE